MPENKVKYIKAGCNSYSSTQVKVLLKRFALAKGESKIQRNVLQPLHNSLNTNSRLTLLTTCP
jgi:hypothetical protein